MTEQNKTIAEVLIEQIHLVADWNNKNLPGMQEQDFVEAVRVTTATITDLTRALVSVSDAFNTNEIKGLVKTP